MEVERPEGAVSNPYIEQFKLLAKATSGKATAAIIDKVLAHKNILVFSELVELDCVQNLRGTESEGSLRLLEIFAYGVYKDYLDNQATLPTLSAPQLSKLRQLTVVEEASKQKVLTYEQLLTTTGTSSSRELEDLIIEAIYNGLLSGRLSHREKVFHVENVMGRDVLPSKIDEMLAQIGAWCDRSEELIGTLDHTMKSVKQSAATHDEQELAEQVRKTFHQVRQSMDLRVSLADKLKPERNSSSWRSSRPLAFNQNPSPMETSNE